MKIDFRAVGKEIIIIIIIIIITDIYMARIRKMQQKRQCSEETI